MICWERVNELREEMGADDFQEVVGLFLEEVEEVLVRLQSNPDPAAYEQDMHFLKGSAMNLGPGFWRPVSRRGTQCGAGWRRISERGRNHSVLLRIQN